MPEPKRAEIFAYLVELQKSGYRSQTIESHSSILRYLPKNCDLHTFRHYVACRLYWQTKDILYVKNFLGRRSTTSTMKYLQLVEFKEEDQFVRKAVTTAEEAVKIV